MVVRVPCQWALTFSSFSESMNDSTWSLGLFDVLHTVTFSRQCLWALDLLPICSWIVGTPASLLQIRTSPNTTQTLNNKNSIPNSTVWFMHFLQCLIMRDSILHVLALTYWLSVPSSNRYWFFGVLSRNCNDYHVTFDGFAWGLPYHSRA